MTTTYAEMLAYANRPASDDPIIQIARLSGGRTAVALHRDGQFFGLVYDAATRDEALRTLGRWASTPDMEGFRWYDAAMMARAITREETECSGK